MYKNNRKTIGFVAISLTGQRQRADKHGILYASNRLTLYNTKSELQMAIRRTVRRSLARPQANFFKIIKVEAPAAQ